MKRRELIRYGSAGAVAGLAGTLACASPRSRESAGRAAQGPGLKTALCERLKIELPILQSGMLDVAGPVLVAAVSEAGGLGILTATMVPVDVLKARIAEIRKKTSKPFGVNLVLHQDLFPPAEFDISDELNDKVHATLNGFRRTLGIPESRAKPPRLPPAIQAAYEVILEEKVPVFSIGLGNPTPEMVEQCHARGIKVISMISTVEDALTISKSGVDVIVAQGHEAGGHRSTWRKRQSKEEAAIGTMPLTSAVVRAVQVPVVAAGGIVNGRGLKAALALGAQGVLMGTRFIATTESMAPECYKRRILEGGSDDTTVTDIFTGMYARVLRNRFTADYASSGAPVFPPGRQSAATGDIIKAAAQQNNAEYYTLYAGQGVGEIDAIKSAAEVINDIVADAR